MTRNAVPDILRIAIAQLNPTFGDVAGNLARAREARADAARQGADLVLFTELFLAGYPPEDLVLKPAFLKACESAAEAIAADTADGGPGVIIGTPTLRLRSDYLAIVTLGFGEIVRIIARNLEITGGASGLVGIERPAIFGFKLVQVQHFYYAFLVLALIAVFVCLSVERSRIGRAWFYVRYDEDAAAGIGINRVWIKLQAYMMGAVIASLAGCLYAAKMTAISPESFTFSQSLIILLGVVLGGMGRIPGVILGAILVALLPEVLRGVGTYRPLVTAVALLAIMLFRPNGLWPDKRV